MTAWQMPESMSMGPVGLRVLDVDRVGTYYRDIVGLSLLEQSADRVVLGTSQQPLLVLVHDPSATPRPRAAAGLYHTAFRVASRVDLGDALTRIQGSGSFTGASDHGVSEALYLQDPEGNGIEIYRDRPKRAWPHQDDGTLHIPTDPLDLEGLREVASGELRVPTDTDIGHVHLEVTDLGQSRNWYVDTLGFKRRYEPPQAAFLAAGEYHHHLGLNTWQARTGPRSGAGLAWFSLLVDDDTLVAIHDGTESSLEEGCLTIRDPDEIPLRLATRSDYLISD